MRMHQNTILTVFECKTTKDMTGGGAINTGKTDDLITTHRGFKVGQEL